jgi:hypothetical protein
VTRHHCPLCDWHTDDPGPDAEALRVAVYPEALARQHAAVVEAVIRGHLKTHPAEEWAAEVSTLRAGREAWERALEDRWAYRAATANNAALADAHAEITRLRRLLEREGMTP